MPSEPKKRVEVAADPGSPATVVVKPSSNTCLGCQKIVESKIVRCEKCASGCYCSSNCKEVHAPAHEHLCVSIQNLEKLEFQKRGFSVREEHQVGVQNRLVSLIGEKPILNCK